MKVKAVVSLLVLFVVANETYADITYTCTQEGMERIIKITYQDQETKIPCEVTYDKGQGSQLLWYAENDSGYCEHQARKFIAKQEGWGWKCASDEPTDETSFANTSQEEPRTELQQSSDTQKAIAAETTE